MTKIKICGLTRPIDIEMANEALPDYIGFVFAKSRRQVTEQTAAELKNRLHPEIKAVGVFVNEDPAMIIRLCQSGIIDMIQLHGDEDETYMEQLRTVINNPIIKAVRVRGEEDIMKAGQYHCDYLLLDAYKENEYGGSGVTFDWTLINALNRPFFLAGGINTDNVSKALELASPYGIDISSGVETEGFKDRNKIMEIITRVRSVR